MSINKSVIVKILIVPNDCNYLPVSLIRQFISFIGRVSVCASDIRRVSIYISIVFVEREIIMNIMCS